MAAAVRSAATPGSYGGGGWFSPASVHLAAYLPLHTLDFGVGLSLIGSATLALVMATGVARIEGTFFLVCGSVIVTPLVSGTWPFASCAMELMAGPAPGFESL